MKTIRKIPYSSLPLAILACGIGSACFSYLFGGDGFDALTAFFCGLILEPYLYWVDKHGMSKFLTNLSASALATLCGGLLLLAGVGHNMDMIIIGSIIRLVPGVAQMCIRDRSWGCCAWASCSGASGFCSFWGSLFFSFAMFPAPF